MTKTANRAAARAYQAEQQEKRQEQAIQDAANADIVELSRLRRYLIFNRRSEAAADLIKALDEYAERITGDRRALHERPHSIGL